MTTTHTTGPDVTEASPDLLPLISRLAEIAQTTAELDTEAKRIKTDLRAALTIGQKVTINGSPVLQIQPNRRFSPDLAAQTLPESLLALCTVSKVDSATAKKNLPPALYEQCMADAGEAKVVLL